ncbi:MAG: dTDP-4-dehydrorhamnose 3,5-epimerase family protein [Candidatus Aenigmarchaeota archaeon]|nr:dTDP-4-dehydrorhamnose 3,5-epimerase family protein [Candidatus Aenigmarchaeota archaeon]
MSEKNVETTIDGLRIKQGNVIHDSRGFLAELSPTGVQNEFFKAGVKNIYVSTSTKKNVSRAGHFHHKNIENFFTLSGTALWMFVDMRKDSPTYNKLFAVVLGTEKPTFIPQDPVYTIDTSGMLQVLVPIGVYHVYWQLTDTPVTVLAIASEPYDKDDYERIEPKDIPQIQEKLAKYKMVTE